MNRKRIAFIIAFIFVLIVVGFIGWAIWASRTGLEDKTLWDLLDLIIVPVLLAIGAYWLNLQQKERDAEKEKQRREETDRIEADNQHEVALQNYLATMSTLLVDKGLKNSEEIDPVRDVARSQTLITLRMLDSTRKSLLVQFLFEAELIKKEPGTIVSLSKADLSGVKLGGANLVAAKYDKYTTWTNDFDPEAAGAELVE